MLVHTSNKQFQMHFYITIQGQYSGKEKEGVGLKTRVVGKTERHDESDQAEARDDRW